MKKMFLFAAIVGIVLAGCSKDKAAEYTMITTVPAGEHKVYITGTGTATIDWGDGYSDLVALENFPAVPNDVVDYYFRHTYTSAGVKNINITGDNIHSLYTGHTEAVTALNVGKIPSLKILFCSFEKLTSLDVSKNTALEHLNCEVNNLTTLNASGCTALSYLHCSSNQLTTLNVSNCTALEYLHCYINQLTTLNVSGCTALMSLWCEFNQLNAVALNAVFTALPTRPASSKGVVQVGGNQGVTQSGYNRTIAIDKNWDVYE